MIWKRVKKKIEKMKMIALTIGFGTDKLVSDRKDRDVATTDRCLRISAENITRRNSIGSCVC